MIAILRGVKSDEVLAIGEALYHAGVKIVEVPLNSPMPFTSIQILANAFAGKMIVGAGTVLSASDVNLLYAHGGQISVSPDCNPETIKRALELGLEPLPGVFTPTEAFAAVRNGATNLKLFPAEVANPATIKAWKAVLPKHIHVHAVGGVTPENMQTWRNAGATGFGIGSNIFKAGHSAEQVGTAARSFVAAWNKLS